MVTNKKSGQASVKRLQRCRVTSLTAVLVLLWRRQLCALAHSLRAEGDPDFITFSAIHSESDHFPVGVDRSHRAADALQRKDAERRALEQRWYSAALIAARNLLEKYT